ncbi:MAG: cobalamin-dependent protein [Desulfobacterales bacterium]
MTEINENFIQALLTLNRLEAKRIVTMASCTMMPIEIAEGMIVKALENIGEGWQQGDIALSQVYMSGRICEELMDDLLPPGAPDRKNKPPIAIATLEDYHLLGKRIVYSVLRANGFDLKDYGRVTVDEAVRRADEDRLRVLLISTLMLPSALHVRDLVVQLKSACPDVKVVVGGAPFIFDPELWREIRADAMGRSASEAAGIIEKITGGVQ